jgi:mono/diheme cytochrome c family protein
MKITITFFITILLIMTGCSNSDENGSQTSNSSAREKLAKKFDLTLFELDNGIGPIKEKIAVGDIDKAKAGKGEKIFETKCIQCHKLDERYTGPALRDVAERRSPEYILNMILNPEEMTKRHPEAKKLLGIYANQMTFQNVTYDDAINLLEYLRMESSH